MMLRWRKRMRRRSYRTKKEAEAMLLGARERGKAEPAGSMEGKAKAGLLGKHAKAKLLGEREGG